MNDDEKVLNNNNDIKNEKLNESDISNTDSENNIGKSGEENKKVILVRRYRNNNDENSYSKNKKHKNNKPASLYANEIIEIKRVVKVVKGGRRFRFSVLMVIGDKKGKVGYAIGKANEIPNAAKKALQKAEKNIIKINFNEKTKSIPHEISGKHCASKIVMFPAPKGTGIIAGGSARNVLTFLGIQNVYAKSYGSTNRLNLIKATIKALNSIISKEQVNI